MTHCSEIVTMQRKKAQNLENSSKKRDGSVNADENVRAIAAGVTEISQNEGLDQSNDVSFDKTEDLNHGMLKYMSCPSLVGVLKVIFLVIIVPPILNYASLQRESASLLKQDGMHAGPQGNKLFMNCSGRGLPLIMMDTPGGFSSDIWSLIQSKLAKVTKVCIYDRAGLGLSEKIIPHFHGNQQSNASSQDFKYGQHLPTTENMVQDIHHLLKTVLKNNHNVVLVAGGLGAINARFYARFYDNIYGIVLINTFHENMFADEKWVEFWYHYFIPSLQVEQLLAVLGVTRLGILSGLFQPSILMNGQFEREVAIKLKHLSCKSQHLSSGIMEHYYMNESLAQLKILQKLRNFPKKISVTLVSSKNFSSHLPLSLNQLWFKNQELLANDLFPKSERTIVDNDFNAVYFSDAETIVNAVKKLVKRFRETVKQSANI